MITMYVGKCVKLSECSVLLTNANKNLKYAYLRCKRKIGGSSMDYRAYKTLTVAPCPRVHRSRNNSRLSQPRLRLLPVFVLRYNLRRHCDHYLCFYTNYFLTITIVKTLFYLIYLNFVSAYQFKIRLAYRFKIFNN